jgi:hypothetical protein
MLLTANIAAPFKASTLGRALLDGLQQKGATTAVLRVRAHAPIGSGGGYRAVVGIARGGSDLPLPRPIGRAFWTFLSPPAASSRPSTLMLATRPHPPLRC